MARMTDEEADALDEYYTKNPPVPGPNGTGFFAQRRKAARSTLVIDSETCIADLLAVMGARRLRVDVDETGRRGVIAPVVTPDDYDNDTDYLCAIPGMAESIIVDP